MLPVNSGGHTAYQDFLLVNLRKHYPVPDSISPSTWDIIVLSGKLNDVPSGRLFRADLGSLQIG